jgi:beta-lactamase superfamily II metal-dependent hydrolase
MKKSIISSTLLVGGLIISTAAVAQKKNETSAAVEFKNKYQMALMSGDNETAKKALISAKEFIDLLLNILKQRKVQKHFTSKGKFIQISWF